MRRTYIGSVMAAIRPSGLILLGLLVVPLAEIACFIAIGGAIGIGWTLLLILVTAVIGTALLRVQGFGLIERIRGEARAGRVPAREVVHGAMLLVAGVLLLTPGFVTDALGFLLFVPALRDVVWRALRSRIHVVAGAPFGTGADRDPFAGADEGRRTRSGTIDLDEEDYRRVDDGEPHSDDGPEPSTPPTPRPDTPWGR